jgi:adenylosuccinate synthase
MPRTFAVIGAGFGDEGKGHLTDYLATKDPARTIVVRANGGAQAGHRVVAAGDEHVFSHWGSGSLAGAATYLSRHFIVNPELFAMERKFDTEIFVDSHAFMTTPYDVLLNHMIEHQLRHGSCGSGVWETVVRCQEPEFRTWGLMGPLTLHDRLDHIRKNYVLPRAFKAAGAIPTEAEYETLMSDVVLDNFMDSVQDFQNSVMFIGGARALLQGYSTVIFEGAQGLLLDQDHEFQPHVTASSTGLDNIEEVCMEAGISSVEAIYVLRSYMTRHGNGPFPTEDRDMVMALRGDVNNPPNRWQGAMRYGKLDIPLIRDAIQCDLMARSIEVNAGLAVNHLDQYDDQSYEKLGLPVHYRSYGPDRADIKEVA